MPEIREDSVVFTHASRFIRSPNRMNHRLLKYVRDHEIINCEMPFFKLFGSLMDRMGQLNELRVSRISEEGDEVRKFMKRITKKLGDQLNELHFNPGTTLAPD